MPLTAGPYEEIAIADAAQAPFYLLRFDKDGRSESPGTEQHLIEALAREAFTDVYLFSHGWNNDFSTALSKYRSFIAGYGRLRRTRGLGFDRPYQPVLVGVIWPSTALVLPWEGGPQFAGKGGEDRLFAAEETLVEDLAGDVDPSLREKFYALAERREGLTEEQAEELVRMLASLYASGDPDVGDDRGPDPEVLMASWRELPSAKNSVTPIDFDDFGTVSPTRTAPASAGSLSRFDPRDALRILTVWKMKDRAGRVGASGVGTMLRAALDAAPTDAKFHLIGHSFGARLLLTAVAKYASPGSIDSMLLLQPAVSHLCFADRIDETGQPGGYGLVLDLVRKPILSTFSAHDFPLTRVFHLALRRARDLGEAKIAAGEPPNRYAALGGFGPRGLSSRARLIEVKEPLDLYEFGPGSPEIYGVDATKFIPGHGDVGNESTWWALYCLARE